MTKAPTQTTIPGLPYKPSRPTVRTRAFTIIELLVVIAIIGLLASVVIASLSGSRVKARDTRRTQDMHTIRTALELYSSDNGHYPNTNSAWTSFDAPSYVNSDIYSPNAIDLKTALQPYLKGNLKDPTQGTGDDGYLYISNGTNFCILFYRAPEDMRNYETYQIAMNRCGSVGANGMCTGINAIYTGIGTYASGC